MKLDRNAICELIPHAGSMCLLDGVETWDENRIICTARTHYSPDNPLRSARGVPAITALEYGAQAMAVHGGLRARIQRRCISNGYLAAVHDARFHIDRLDLVQQPLIIDALRLISSDTNQIYQIEIRATKLSIAEARLTIINLLELER